MSFRQQNSLSHNKKSLFTCICFSDPDVRCVSSLYAYTFLALCKSGQPMEKELSETLLTKRNTIPSCPFCPSPRVRLQNNRKSIVLLFLHEAPSWCITVFQDSSFGFLLWASDSINTHVHKKQTVVLCNSGNWAWKWVYSFIKILEGPFTSTSFKKAHKHWNFPFYDRTLKLRL